MKTNYDFGRLGVTEKNKEEYINLLSIEQDYFVPARFVSMDKVSIEIEYSLENLYSYEELAKTNSVFKVQAMISLVELVQNTNKLMNINLDQSNIYFDRAANAFQLERAINPKKGDETKFTQEIKALLANLFVAEGYESILSSKGKFLSKNTMLESLGDVEDLDTLKEQLSVLVNKQLDENYTSKVSVDKNYVNKLKRISKFKSFAILILIAISAFMVVVYIPNRTSQLRAIASYESATYENVLVDMHKTKITSMSPVTKYIMAESTIKLSQLSDTQKENILYNLSPSVEEGILDFWVYIGQDNLDKAYDQSIKNNDAQQKAYVLLLLIDRTQNDSSLKTEEKETMISSYQGELDSVMESIEGE